MKNQSFTIKCDNCGEETGFADNTDTFSTQIKIISLMTFMLGISCEACGNSITTE